MYNTAKKKILVSKVQSSPFPYLFIRNLIGAKELANLNRVLPNYDSILEENVLYQSSSKSKKTILTSVIFILINSLKNKTFSKILL